jgi:hypothetical protein
MQPIEPKHCGSRSARHPGGFLIRQCRGRTANLIRKKAGLQTRFGADLVANAMGGASEYFSKCPRSLSQRARDVERNPGVGGHCIAQVLIGITYVSDLIGLLVLKEAEKLDISRLRHFGHGGGQGINAAGLEGLVLNSQASFQCS